MKLFDNIPDMRKVPENPLLFIWEALYGVRKWAFVGVILAFLLQLMKVYVPVFFSEMIDYFAKITPEEFEWAHMWWFLALIFASYIGQSVFRMVREVLEANNVRNFMNAKIKLFAVDYLAQHSENYFSSQKNGQLSQKVMNCAEKATEVHGAISMLYSNIFLIFINFFFISRVSLWFLLLVVFFGSISALIAYKMSFNVRELNRTADNMFDDFNGVVADSISNALNVKANGSEEYEISFVKKVFAKCKKARIRALTEFQDGIRIQHALLCLFEVCTMLLLVKLWYQKSISIGDVTLVLMLMNTIMSTISNIAGKFGYLNTLIGSLQAAMVPFVVKHEIVDAPKAKKLKVSGGAIEFKNVKFGYDKKKVFNNLSFKIKAGEKVGLVGVSGSGKSTLINLLQRAYNVQSGEILIDGQNIAMVKQGSLHDAIALIPQDTALFHRTVEQNITYGNLHARESEVEDAAKKAYADEFIKGLPKGYHTQVGEKGVKLSGGQRQRIAIARAILKNSPILILDEATSALDSEAEAYIQKAMKNLMKNKTVIAIAHRLSTLKEMDRIIVLDRGKIVEDGIMEELLVRGGEFQHLWDIQNK